MKGLSSDRVQHTHDQPGQRFNDLDLADGEISGNVCFSIGNATRMDGEDPSTNTQPGSAQCFNPARRLRDDHHWLKIEPPLVSEEDADAMASEYNRRLQIHLGLAPVGATSRRDRPPIGFTLGRRW